MDKQKLIQRLMGTFLEELEEHVRSLNQDLLALEKNPPAEEQAEALKKLFRTAHSLKGAARSVDVGLIEGACHRLEEILSGARDERLTIDPELFALLFATVDAIEEAGMRLREQQDLADAPLAGLLARLEAAASTPPPPAAASLAEPGPTPDVLARHEPPALPLPPRLPVEKPQELAATAVPSSFRVMPGAEMPPEPSLAGGSMRVSAEKLDNLVARIGELLVARRRVESRAGDLESLLDFIDRWKTDWHRVEKTFDKALGDDSEQNGRETGLSGVSRRAALVLRQTGPNLRRLHKELDRLAGLMKGDHRLLRQVTAPLDDEVRAVRMLPFAQACAGLDRLVRDLAHVEGKEAELRIRGGNVELDRSILEGLKDPLRHLVRNALDHGIEAPTDRQQAGKLRSGLIEVSAALRGSQVEVVVRDDGRGLDLDALREQARRRKIPEPADDRDLTSLVFLPGFSTSAIITDVSGRGVGLDVVKSYVESLHGTVELSFDAAKGTRFILTVPLTLSTLRAVLVRAGGQTYALAGTNIHKLVRAGASDLCSVAGREMLSLGGPPLPFAYLADALGSHAEMSRPDGKMPVLIVAAGEKRMAFAVDELVTEQEILIKSLGVRIRHVPLAAGATFLPSGRIALVLNAANLIRSALRQAPVVRAETPAKPTLPARKRLLVAEDSVTTRALEKSILEAAGYDVATVVDGLAAWQFLQDHDVDLVVSDVEMPNMDGFELAQAIRGLKKYQHLPVVLVTARESEQDKIRGIEAGADAYLIKSAFDQRNLLETIAQLL